jgi:hypothetical protein
MSLKFENITNTLSPSAQLEFVFDANLSRNGPRINLPAIVGTFNYGVKRFISLTFYLSQGSDHHFTPSC